MPCGPSAAKELVAVVLALVVAALAVPVGEALRRHRHHLAAAAVVAVVAVVVVAAAASGRWRASRRARTRRGGLR